MTLTEQLAQLKTKFAGYGTTISAAERTEFNNLCDVALASVPSDLLPVMNQKLDELKIAVSNIPTTPPPLVNQPPTVNAGADTLVTLPATLTLSPTVSDDGLPTGSTLVKSWSKVSGPGTVSFSGDVATFSAAGSYVLRLTVTDSVLSVSDDVSVTVNPVVVVPPPPPPGQKTLLTPADFTYQGFYDVTVMPNTSYGFTHRYVGGEIRFLTTANAGKLVEFSVAGKSFGQTVSTATNTWNDIGGFDIGYDYRGLFWDEANQRLWSNGTQSYQSTEFPVQIYTRTLNANGTISNLHGPVSLQGIPQKRVFGGATAIPAWFQQQYSVGPYLVGWGGGTSLILAAGNNSCGPAMYAMPDPAGFSNGASIPTSQFKTLADYAPATQHRGVRLWKAGNWDTGGSPLNYHDGGDPRPNPPTPPTFNPSAGAQWLSPRADGRAYWPPYDAYWNTGNWIDTPTKHGFIAVLSGDAGRAWYMTSNIWRDYKTFELHIFDPTVLGQVATGAKPVHAVEPTSMTTLTLPNLGGNGQIFGDMAAGQAVAGATFDSVGKKLYLLGMGINGFSTTNRLYVFNVNV